MCGIAGSVMFEASRSPDQQAVEAMSGSLAYRGPDDAATWLSDRAALCL